MEVENVEELLDYVFNEKDFSIIPSEAEYHKLTRIMNIMIRFYKKGSNSKKEEYESQLENLKLLDQDEKMIKEQLEALSKFPPIHPKYSEYESVLDARLNELENARKRIKDDLDHWKKLYEWSLKIVDTVTWLGEQLEEYSNEVYKTNFDIDHQRSILSVDLFRIYKSGLDEITYNLQESQDFFDASLDGRLSRFHEIEKDMIESQLEVVRSYPKDSKLRQAIEPDLEKDLEYALGNMKVDPNAITHREKMRIMHGEFFSLLKWQRERMFSFPFDHPEKLTGDVEALKMELELKKKETIGQAVNHELVPTDEKVNGIEKDRTNGIEKDRTNGIENDNVNIIDGDQVNRDSAKNCSNNEGVSENSSLSSIGKCPMKSNNSSVSGGIFDNKNGFVPKSCPFSKPSLNGNSPANSNNISKTDDLKIHRLYD